MHRSALMKEMFAENETDETWCCSQANSADGERHEMAQVSSMTIPEQLDAGFDPTVVTKHDGKKTLARMAPSAFVSVEVDDDERRAYVLYRRLGPGCISSERH